MVRFILEALLGLALAVCLTFIAMETMAHLGHWSNPPGMTELAYTLIGSALAAVAWRAWHRAKRSA